jgi:hypothetical protein
MKLALFSLLTLSVACEYGTIKYGYYWNPLTILEKADEALAKNDLGGWTELLSGNTLCIYGSAQGMSNLNSSLSSISTDSFKEPLLQSKKYLNTPSYIGYWVYYQEVYRAEAKTKTGAKALSLNITCNFGHPQKRTDLVNASLGKYKTRSCSITKIQNHLNPIVVPDYCR